MTGSRIRREGARVLFFVRLFKVAVGATRVVVLDDLDLAQILGEEEEMGSRL